MATKYQKYRETILRNSLKYYQSHKEECKQKSKENYNNDKEKHKLYREKYRLQNLCDKYNGNIDEILKIFYKKDNKLTPVNRAKKIITDYI
jgi:hypothetical protein